MSYDLTNVVAKPDVTALQMGVPGPSCRHCQLSAVCLVLHAGRHQYCRYYPRNNYHTLSLAESEYRGIEAAAFDSEGKYFLIITNIFMTKEWMG